MGAHTCRRGRCASRNSHWQCHQGFTHHQQHHPGTAACRSRAGFAFHHQKWQQKPPLPSQIMPGDLCWVCISRRGFSWRVHIGMHAPAPACLSLCDKKGPDLLLACISRVRGAPSQVPTATSAQKVYLTSKIFSSNLSSNSMSKMLPRPRQKNIYPWFGGANGPGASLGRHSPRTRP